jgi:DNA-binding LytR/AlgR family response regulator
MQMTACELWPDALASDRPAARTPRPGSGSATATSLRTGNADRLCVLVVVDGVARRDELTDLLRASSIVGEVIPATDAAQALRLLHGRRVDVAFVEIDLPGLDGIDLARVLQQFAEPPAVVFVADQPTRALEAFEVGAVDYLVRPTAPERIMRSLGRVQPPVAASPLADQADQPDPPTGAPLPSALQVAPNLQREARWITVHRDYVRVHTATGSHLLTITMGQLVDAWAAAGIVRIHRSYAVQMAAVSELRRRARSYTVVVDGIELPVSRRAARVVKERLLAG